MSASILNPLYPKPTIVGNALVAGERLAVGGSVVSKVTAPNQYTNTIMFDIQGDDVWCTTDGTTPSSSNGHRLYAGRSYTWSKEMVRVAKFIQVTGAAQIHFSECAA